jgi:hypothetical protein
MTEIPGLSIINKIINVKVCILELILPKIVPPNFLYLINFPIFLKHFCFRQFYSLNLGIFIQRSNLRAKVLGPKQKVFLKLKNVSDKKLGLVILPSTIS